MKKTTLILATSLFAGAGSIAAQGNGISMESVKTPGNDTVSVSLSSALSQVNTGLQTAAGTDSSISMESAKAQDVAAATLSAGTVSSYLPAEGEVMPNGAGTVSMEAFSGVRPTENIVITAAIENELDVYIDPVAELFLPDVTIDPNKSGLEINWTDVDIHESYRRDGKSFSLTNSLVDHTIWGETDLRIYPILRENGSHKTSDNLDVTAKKNVGGHVVAPILLGKNIDLINCARTSNELSAGTVGSINTELSNDLRFQSVVFALKDDRRFELDTLAYPSAVWDGTAAGKSRELVGSLEINEMVIPLSAKASDKNTLASALDAKYAGWSIVINLEIGGKGDASKGNVRASQGVFEIVKVIDSTKVVHTEGSDFTAVVDGLELAPKSWFPYASITNENNVKEGFVAKSHTQSKSFPVGNLKPFTVASSTFALKGDDTDATVLANGSEIFARSHGSSRTSNKIKTILETVKSITALANAGVQNSIALPSDHIATYAGTREVDIKNLNSIQDGNKIDDVSGSIVASTKSLVDEMLTQSNYENIIRSFGYDKYEIIIGGAMQATNLLKGKEDDIFKADNAKVIIEGSNRNAYLDADGNAIIMVSVRMTDISASKPNLFGFGVNAKAPEIVRDEERSEGSTNEHIKVKAFYPRERVITFAKVAGVITVKNLDKLSEKTVLHTKDA